MLQVDLFSTPPRARRRDPVTSHLAAEKVAGRASAHRQMIAAAIRRRPGMTYREIAEVTGLEPVAVGRRLVEVAREGLARSGEARTVNGSAMRTWWPA
jgi:predicted ArsR family transcriptional regulator